MRAGNLFHRLIALLVALAMGGSLASPVWAGPECPHGHAAGHHAQHHSYPASELSLVNPDKPCKCDQHSDMTTAECVALSIGMALPAGTSAPGLQKLDASFVPVTILIRSGIDPERDPHPPKSSPLV